MKAFYCAAMAAVILAGCAGRSPEAPVPGSDARVIVQLFEWPWADVAEECEAFLGPAGYAAVQVSPPSENAVVEDPPRPWWERYQPVSYRLETRSGDRAAFADMVTRCRAAGVDVYVDAILNHMTGVYAGRGVAGTPFGEYDYPGLYGYDDFHHCGLTEGDDIEDWNDPVQVRTCELVNLADLDTGAEKVRARLAAYLNDLVDLGVAGFRVDAARHIAPEDLRAIFGRVTGTPFVYQEVIDPDPPHWSAGYYAAGLVTEFQYGRRVSEMVRAGTLNRLHGAGSIWETTPFLPGDRALVFIDNHDNQRSHGDVLTFRDGARYDLAVAFMLAYPYGTPRVMSSYAFTKEWQGPPTGVDGRILRVHEGETVRCGGATWQCEHRHSALAGMVRFRAVTVPADTVTHWWTNGRDQIAFGRGNRGFVAFNAGDAPMHETLQTGLPPGVYCNVTDGTFTDEGCTGTRLHVGPDGTAAIALGPMQVLAVHAEAREFAPAE